MAEPVPSKGYAQLTYLYRDAGNFKIWNEILLVGSINAELHRVCTEALECGEFFIPEQVGLPSLQRALARDGGVSRRLDHAWHTFESIRNLDGVPINSEEAWGSVNELASAFSNVGEWDVRLSPMA